MPLRKPLLSLLLLPLLSACHTSGPPLSAAIVTPASHQTVSGTTAVQVSVPTDASVSLVRVYARGAGETGKGVLLGSANRAPYVVSWVTGSTPNGSGLELYAVASGPDNADGTSDAVSVEVNNTDAPSLSYFTSFNLPVTTSALGFTSTSFTAAPPRLNPLLVKAEPGHPQDLPIQSAAVLRPQADPPRKLAVEWGWAPYATANGYDIQLSTSSLAGPYTTVKSQLAVPTGLQQDTELVTSAQAGDTVYGVVGALINNATSKTSLSNAGTATFLAAQQTAAPANGQVVSDGRPILTWPKLVGATNYLYFLCDTPCSDPNATDRWTNYPNAQTSLSAVYPSSQAPLKSGTYYWWVAGVKFNAQGKAVAFSYSALSTLVVP